MKSLIVFSITVCLLVSQLLMAQNKEITELLTAYYGIKNALVADDGVTASHQAGSFLGSVEDVSKSSLGSAQQKVWQEQKATLISASEAISKTDDVTKQREQLNSLSGSMFAILKTLDEFEAPVYYQYCPMKKAYWLSHEKDIKNPYYGQKMLTCGSVKETLK